VLCMIFERSILLSVYMTLRKYQKMFYCYNLLTYVDMELILVKNCSQSHNKGCSIEYMVQSDSDVNKS